MVAFFLQVKNGSTDTHYTVYLQIYTTFFINRRTLDHILNNLFMYKKCLILPGILFLVVSCCFNSKAQTISGPQNPCPDVIYEYSISSIPPCPNNLPWSVSGGQIIEVSQNKDKIKVKWINTPTSINAKVYYTYYKTSSSGGCTTDIVSIKHDVKVRVFADVQSLTISKDCSFRGSIPLSITPVAIANQYTWSDGLGWTQTTTTPSVNYNVTTNNSISINVIGRDNLCTTTGQVASIQINRTNNAPVITNDFSTLCGSGNVTINPVEGADSYTWETSTSALLINGQSSPVTITGLGGTSVVVSSQLSNYKGTVKVKANKPLCTNSTPYASREFLIGAVPVNWVSAPSKVCSGELFTVQAEPLPDVSTYVWGYYPANNPNDKTIVNQFGLNYQEFGITDPGNYYIYALPVSLCGTAVETSTSSTLVNVDFRCGGGSTMQVQNKSNEAIMLLYPNPSTSEITLKTSEVVKLGKYRIVSLDNQIVQTGVFENNKSINVSSLSPGYYNIIVESADFQKSLKFQKQ